MKKCLLQFEQPELRAVPSQSSCKNCVVIQKDQLIASQNLIMTVSILGLVHAKIKKERKKTKQNPTALTVPKDLFYATHKYS